MHEITNFACGCYIIGIQSASFKIDKEIDVSIALYNTLYVKNNRVPSTFITLDSMKMFGLFVNKNNVSLVFLHALSLLNELNCNNA